MRLWLRTHGTTAAAILIAGLLTAWFGYLSLGSLLGTIDPERLDQGFGRSVLSAAPAGSTADAGGAAANASAIVGIVIGAIVLLSAITIVGLLFRGEWAGEAGLVIYGLLGFVATAASLGGLAADPPAPSAWGGLLIGLTNFAVVGLLLAPATARDFRRR